MTLSFKTWMGHLAGFCICAALIGFALFLQHVKGEDPCPLCMLQRIAFIAVGLVFLAAALHRPGRAGVLLYGGLQLLFTFAGAAVAGRHVWLQSLPKHMVPECGPGLDYILERFPLSKALDLVLRGSGECAEKGWTFLGLSIAGWALVWFVLLSVLAIALIITALREHSERAAQAEVR